MPDGIFAPVVTLERSIEALVGETTLEPVEIAEVRVTRRFWAFRLDDGEIMEFPDKQAASEWIAAHMDDGGGGAWHG